MHRGILPPLHHSLEVSQDTTHDLLEEVLLQMGTSPKAPFTFTQLSRLPSVCSLSPGGRWACLTTPDNQRCYCIRVRVTLGDEEATNLLSSHAWNGLLIADMFQDGLKE